MTDSVVDRLLAAINAQDPDAVAECFTENYVCEWPAHPNLTFTGRDMVRSNQVRRFAGRKTVQAEIVRSVSVQDDELWQEWYFHGDPSEPEERGVIVLVLDPGRGLIQRSRFFMETVREVEAM